MVVVTLFNALRCVLSPNGLSCKEKSVKLLRQINGVQIISDLFENLTKLFILANNNTDSLYGAITSIFNQVHMKT